MLEPGPEVPFHDEAPMMTPQPETDAAPDTIAELAIDQITVAFNHRRHFDEVALEQLAASIKHIGVIQPITVRPLAGGGYELVAGERRLRASKLAGRATIPAYVRAMDDATALSAGLEENAQREAVSVAEEAQACRRAMSLADGDEAEASRLLGWNRTKLKARLLLLNATQAVLDAQMTRQITLGHAELLATVPAELQTKLLTRIVENKASVEEFRKQLSAYAQELASACFDTGACAGCPNNSTTQADMFDASIGGGRCSNRTCWGEKTEAHLQALKQTLMAEVAVSFFDRDKLPDTYTKLHELGKEGVGTEQFTACKGCGHYGSLIATKPGQEGRVTEGLCFNRVCNAEKIDAFAKASTPATPASPASAPDAPEPPVPAASGASTPSKAAPSKSKQASTTPAVASIPKRVMEANATEIRKLATTALLASDRMQAAATLYGLHLATHPSLANPLSDAGDGQRHAPKLTLRHFVVLTDTEMAAARARMIAALYEVKPENGYAPDPYQVERVIDSATVIAVTRTSPSETFVLTKEYLETHTKALLEVVLTEAGFIDSLEGDSPEAKKRAFRKFMSQGREEIITQALASNHSFKGFVPSHLRQSLATTINKDPTTVKKVRSLLSGQ